jgi:uncharacterized protein YbjT (DUF2867 family)
VTTAIVGVTGCVGSRLARRLVARGEPVRALVREASRGRAPAGIEAVTGDLLEPATLPPLVRSARVLYYLAHSMGAQPHGTGDLVKDEREAARAVLGPARDAGVERVIFVSGLGASADAASVHLRARFAVEEEVRASGISWTILRAGVLLGPGSVGFEALLRTLATSWVLPLPPWRAIPMQPFALADMLDALERAPREPAFEDRTVEVGTAEVPTYGELVKRVARASGLFRLFVPVPFDLAGVATITLAALAGVDPRMAGHLVETMVRSPAVVRDGGDAMRELGLPIRTLDEALQLALRDSIAERAAREPVPA